MKIQNIINIDPEILGGTPVFTGTRVPIKHLFDYLEGGHTLEEFLDDFDSVSREQAVLLPSFLSQLPEFQKGQAYLLELE